MDLDLVLLLDSNFKRMDHKKPAAPNILPNPVTMKLNLFLRNKSLTTIVSNIFIHIFLRVFQK
jgi:hypothetical protein